MELYSWLRAFTKTEPITVFFFLRKKRVVLNRRRIVQPRPITEKTHKKLIITTATLGFRVFTSSSSIPNETVRRSQGNSRHPHQRRSPQSGDRRGGLTARRRSRENGLPSTSAISAVSEDRHALSATTAEEDDGWKASATAGTSAGSRKVNPAKRGRLVTPTPSQR